jgi:endonuclease IV
MKIGLKLGSRDMNYTEDIINYYSQGYFQYMELFVVPGTFEDTIGYWRQLPIPVGIHAPHSRAGMNLSLRDERKNNKIKLQETFQFADGLNAGYIIFHAGVNGSIEETAEQLRPFMDPRCLVENKPLKGLHGERCIGSTFDDLHYLMTELDAGFCLDFGHAICAANTLRQEPLAFISELMKLQPDMYHLTDGDYKSEYDLHIHYGKGTYPLKALLQCVPTEAKITNEAKHDSEENLEDFETDILYVRSIFEKS